MFIRRTPTLAAGLAAVALLLSACGGDDSASSEDGEAGGTAAGDGSGAGGELLVWVGSGGPGEAVKELGPGFGEENGIEVTTELLPGDSLQTNFVTAAQGGTPPDVICGAHDWIGNLVQNGTIDPVQLPAAAQESFQPLAIEAVTYNGQTYGVPFTMNNLVLYRNTALAPEAPATVEDAVATGKQLQAAGKVSEPLAWPVGQTGNAYFINPLFTSGGGYIFGQGADGGYDVQDLGVGTPQSIEAFRKIGALGEGGENVLKRSINTDNATSLFAEGQTPFLVEGPWQLATLQEAGLEYEVSSIPGFADGQPAQPFITVDACYVASKGANKAIAQEFVTNYLTRTEVQAAHQESAQSVPANVEVLEQIRSEQPLVAAVADAGAENGKIMPSVPEMSAVFDPFGKAEAAVVAGEDPQAAVSAAATAIQRAIGG